MLVDHIPPPNQAAREKVEQIYSGPLVGNNAAESMIACDPKGKLMVSITKLFPTQDCLGFDAYGRVMSGTLEVFFFFFFLFLLFLFL